MMRSGWPRQAVIMVGLLFALTGGAVVASVASSAMRNSPLPLPLPATLEGDGVVRDAQGRLVFFNFRTISPALAYRASAFPRGPAASGTAEAPIPAALLDDSTFLQLRARNIRLVFVAGEDVRDFYAEEGYYRYWAEKTGYGIEARWLPLRPGAAYGRQDGSGLHAAALFLMAMKSHPPTRGAVLVHGEAGKDAIGVIAAAYELWRNSASPDRDGVFRAVLARYVLSDQALRPLETDLGLQPARCASGTTYVCPEWLEGIRTELERIVRL